jgi:hypothetical protein
MTGFVTPPAPLRRIEIQLSGLMHDRMLQRARERNMPLPVFARLLLEAAWSAHAKPPTGDAALDEAVAHAFDEKPEPPAPKRAPAPPPPRAPEPIQTVHVEPPPLPAPAPEPVLKLPDPPAPQPAPKPPVAAAPAQDPVPEWKRLGPSCRQMLKHLAVHAEASFAELAAACVPPIVVMSVKVNVTKIRNALPPGIRIANRFGWGYEVDRGLAELRALLQVEPATPVTAPEPQNSAPEPAPEPPVVTAPEPAPEPPPAPSPEPAKPAAAPLTPGQIKLVRMYRGLDMDLQEIVQVTGFDPELVRACMDAAAPTDRRKRR